MTRGQVILYRTDQKKRTLRATVQGVDLLGESVTVIKRKREAQIYRENIVMESKEKNQASELDPCKGYNIGGQWIATKEPAQSPMDPDAGRDQATGEAILKRFERDFNRALEIVQNEKARQESLQVQGEAELGIHSTKKDVPASEPELPMSSGGSLHNDSIGHSSLQRSQSENAVRDEVLEIGVSALSHMDRIQPSASLQDGAAPTRLELEVTVPAFGNSKDLRRKYKSETDSAMKRVIRSGSVEVARTEILAAVLMDDVAFFKRLGKALEKSRNKRKSK